MGRYADCLATAVSEREWLETPKRRRRRGEVDPIKGKSWPLPPPLNRRPKHWPKPKSRKKKDGDEQKYVQDPNMEYMKRVCRELVCLDVGYLGAGSWRGTGLPDSFGSVDGIAFYCEFKAPGKKVTCEQMDHLRRYLEDGHAALIVATADGFYRWHMREPPLGVVNGVPVY